MAADDPLAAQLSAPIFCSSSADFVCCFQFVAVPSCQVFKAAIGACPTAAQLPANMMMCMGLPQSLQAFELGAFLLSHKGSLSLALQAI